jgi:D-alanyl-D-alanine carboxypeptidase/D-alanyl-D-alanine-endopeptidase (penicillin-binding protein 4)
MRVQIFPARIWFGLFFLGGALTVFLLSATAQPTNFPQTLAELRTRIDAELDQPCFNDATWSVKIASLTTGKTIYENHADRLMSPASNSKLYTAALALNTFGGDHQIVTPIFATINPDDFGRINGDLIVSGRGDPSWNAATNFWDDFAPFVAALTNAGVHRITGDLVADDTFFRGPPFGSSWCVDDLEADYGAEISALTIEDNTAEIRVSPGVKIADPCALELSPPDTGIILVNRTRTTPRDGGDYLEARKLPGSKTIYIFGQLPAGGKGELLDVPVPQPAMWFGAGLKQALAQNGISLDGQVRCVAWPQKPSWNETNLVKIGEVKSPPLRDLIRAFLKPSQNLEADLIFEQVGESLRTADAPPWRTSEELSVAALEKFLATNGIPNDVHFDEGSGLSRNNLTSANATVALLAFMATNRWAKDFYDALPIAGVDGTLRHRMKGTPADNNVHAKTGTLRWANSLSGYVTTAAGEKLVFSFMLNRYYSPPDRRRTKEMDDIAVMLAGFTGRPEQN